MEVTKMYHVVFTVKELLKKLGLPEGSLVHELHVAGEDVLVDRGALEPSNYIEILYDVEESE